MIGVGAKITYLCDPEAEAVKKTAQQQKHKTFGPFGAGE